MTSIARSGAWSSLTQLAPAISALVMTPYVVHGLGPDRYGMYVLAITLLSFLGSFDGGLTASAGRFFSIYAGSGDTTTTTRLLGSLVLAVLAGGTVAVGAVYLAAPTMVQVVRAPADVAVEGVHLIRVMAVVTVGWLLYSVFVALVNAHGRFAWTSLAYVAGYGVLMAGMTWVLLTDGTLIEVGTVLLAQTATCVLLTLPAALRYTDLRGLFGRGGLLHRSEVRAYADFAWKVQLQGLAQLITSQAAALICGAVLRVREVGVYTVGANYALQLKFVPLNALRPVAAQLGRDFGRRGWAARESFERLQRHWVRAVTGWTAMALGSAYVAVGAWLGPSYARAGLVATILVAGSAAWLAAGVLTAWLNTTGHPAVEARYAVLTMTVSLVLIVAFVHPWGIVGVAVATAIAQWLGAAYLVRRAAAALPATFAGFHREVPWAAAVLATLVSAAAAFTVAPWLPSGGPGLLLGAAASVPAGLLYCLLVYGPHATAAVLRRIFRAVGAAGARRRPAAVVPEPVDLDREEAR